MILKYFIHKFKIYYMLFVNFAPLKVWSHGVSEKVCLHLRLEREHRDEGKDFTSLAFYL